MKSKFTRLTAALALLACLAIPLGMRADEASYVFNTDAGIAALGIAKPNPSSGTSLVGPYIVEQITMSVTHGSTDTRVWNSNGTLDLRIYKSGGSLTFTAASGYSITGVTIAGSTIGNFTVDVGTYTSGSWSNGTEGASSVTFTATNTGKINTITVTYSGGGSQLTPCDLALTNAPVELEFDLYDNADAQTISYTTSSTGEITVSQSDYITATVNANNTITVTPVAVTNGAQTITVNQAADDNYAAGSVTFTVNITDSTPSTGTDVTFDATVDKDLNNTSQGEGSIVKDGVTFTCSDGILGNGTEYRLYKNSTTTFSVESGTITQIVFTCPSGNPASGFATQDGWTTNGNNGTWTGSATSVSFVASSKQVRATTIVVTVEGGGTPNPTISADDVNIAYNATNGSIEYTINNGVEGGSLTATTESDWLTLPNNFDSPIQFTCSANEAATDRTATVILTYTYNTDQTVSANVTVTQAAAPLIYSTIPDLFAAATSTETNVLVTFNNWVVSGVSTNGKNVFVTDNNGNGFVIFDNNGGLGNTYTAGDILAGTAVSCNLKKYNGFAELLNVDANDLTITAGGTIAVANVAMADLAGVNTGALVHYDNLTCSVNNNKYYLSDGTTTLQVYNSLYAFDALTDGNTYNITGVYQQFNSTKEVLPRSADDIEEVTSATPTITVSNATVNAPAEGAEGTLTVTYENITTVVADVWFCDAAGTTTATYNWITADINAQNNVEYLVESNNGEARTAYFKVWAYDDEFNEVYSDLVTINQAAYVAPTYAALPFAFDGGKADIENTDGLYQEGLGSDYNSSPYLKFDGEGDYVLLQFNEQPGTLTFDVKGNGSGADPWDGEFKVMVSTDGVDYTDKAVYQTGDLTGTKTTMTISDLASGVRYIKWIYTTKTKGNVALGNIALANVPATYDLTVTFGDSIAAIYVFNADEQSAPLIENGAAGNVSVSAGTSILVSPDAADGYELASLIVNNEDVTSQMNEGSYTFAMPASAVTITATATAIPTVVYAYSRNGVESDYVEVPQNTVIQLESADNLAPNDFTFAGWTTDANNVTNLLAAGSDFTLDDTYEFFAVYAHTTGGASTAKEGASYVKVTSTDEIENGNYLIVYEDGAVAFDGSLETLDDTDNTIDVTIDNETIASNSTTDAAIFTIDVTNGTLMSASGKYIGVDSNSNGLKQSDEASTYTNTFSINEGYNAVIAAAFSGSSMSLRFNAASNQNRFRYYKNAGQQAIQLYKYVGGSTPTPTPVTTYYTRVFLENPTTPVVIAGPSIVPSGYTLDASSVGLYNSLDASKLIIEDGAQLKTPNAVFATVEKNITGYGEANFQTNQGYYLVSAPAATYLYVDSNNGNVDAYMFDASEQGEEWRNFKLAGGAWHIAAGNAVLYASKNDCTLSLDGYGIVYNTPYPGANVVYNKVPATNANVEVPVQFNSGKVFEGFNLIGNPFTCTAYLADGRDFYRMNAAGDAIVLADETNGGNAISVCEGIFVVTTSGEYNVAFTTTEPATSTSGNSNAMLNLSITQNRGSLVDNARIRFGEGNAMPKMVFGDNSRIFFTQGTKDYAVVRSNAEGEMSVSFKAENNSSYTISVNAENVEMNYLHLIDNLTGADIDLLATPSYSFEAKTTDYASRFRLVFNANTVTENSNETFAYYNGSEWVISNMGEATLQVVDMMGRVLSTETVSGNATMNTNSLSAGIYMMRLVKGEDVKVQKIVVR